MLIKWIVCDVPADKRAAFSEAQAAWSALSGAPGFLGQLGGWDGEGRACIAGLWAYRAAYRHFMEHLHDDIFDGNAQAGTYTASRVTLFESVMDVGAALAGASGSTLRVADCQVGEGREARFVEMQQTVWNPGMGGAPGMMGGVFSHGGARRYLVLSRWRDEAAHERYRAERFPALRSRAGATQDLEAVAGHVVDLEPAWSVSTRAPEDRR